MSKTWGGYVPDNGNRNAVNYWRGSNDKADEDIHTFRPDKSKPPAGPPFPSPIKSDGGSQNNSPVKGHFKKQDGVIGLARWGPERRRSITDIRGLANSRDYLCYTNSALTLLMNLDPFVGYLNRVHTTEDEPAQSDLLTLLDDFSRAYWRTHSFSEIEYPAQVVRSYVRNLPAQHSFGVEPFIPNGGEEMHEDAADWLNKVLEICSAQVRHGRKLFGEGHGGTPAANFGALIEPVFQKRQACAGTGTICPNKKVRPKTSTTGDLYCPIIPVGVEADSVSLISTIDKFMRYDTELYCSNCKQLPDYKDKLGRFWNTFVETPEILLFKLNRFNFVGGMFQKTDAPLDIPEYLDLSQYVEKKAAAAAAHAGGTTAVYWLSGVISHIGDLGSGHFVSFVRHHHYKQNWVRISDDDVSWSYLEEAVRAPEALGRFNPDLFPYVLAYTKLPGMDGPDAVTREIGSASVDTDSSEEL